jgi:hypothetical protein
VLGCEPASSPRWDRGKAWCCPRPSNKNPLNHNVRFYAIHFLVNISAECLASIAGMVIGQMKARKIVADGTCLMQRT